MRQTRASAKRQRKSDDDDDYKPSGSKKPRDTQQSERKASGKKRKSARNEGKSAEVQPTSSDPATDSPGSVWSAADVQTIGSELAQNKSWPEIQQDHFPNRTPEACKDYYDLVMKIRPENDPIGSVPQRSPNTNSSNEPEDGTEVYEAVEIPLIPSNTPTGNQQSNSNGEPEDEPMVYEGEKLPSIQPDPLTGNQQSILSSNTPTPAGSQSPNPGLASTSAGGSVVSAGMAPGTPNYGLGPTSNPLGTTRVFQEQAADIFEKQLSGQIGGEDVLVESEY